LTNKIIAPCPDFSIGFSGYGVTITTKYFYEGVTAHNQDRRTFITSSIITKLTIKIIAPSPYFSIGFSGYGVIETSRYFYEGMTTNN